MAVLGVAVFYLLLLARIKLSGHRGNIAEVARQVQEKDKSGQPLHWLERLGVRLGFIYRKEFISLYAMTWCLFNLAEVFLWTTLLLTSVGLVYEVYTIWQLARENISNNESTFEGHVERRGRAGPPCCTKLKSPFLITSILVDLQNKKTEHGLRTYNSLDVSSNIFLAPLTHFLLLLWST